MNNVMWRIEGFDSTASIFSVELPHNHLGIKQAESLLARLVARHLTADQIVSASTAKSVRTIDSLIPRKDYSNNKIIITCGDNPHYVATLIRNPPLSPIE
ncbi:MAG: hypothetical protein JJT99_01465 [Rhodobacteraceae bacterium]|nr:hypothetical protein [Paracoccaceae bacterium]